MQDQNKSESQRIQSLLYQFSQKDILCFREACQFLSLSSSYLYKLTHKQQIPYYKPGGKKIYFKRSELESWLLKNRVKTLEEIEEDAGEYVIRKKRG